MQKKFLLIDPSIIDSTGHHYEYSINVLEAAKESGYKPVLATNKLFKASPQFDYYPVYKYGFWSFIGEPYSLKLRNAVIAQIRKIAYPVFSFAWGILRNTKRTLIPINQSRFDNTRVSQFTTDTFRLVKEIKLGDEDIVFIPNVSHIELCGLHNCLRNNSNTKATWHLLFRRTIDIKAKQEKNPNDKLDDTLRIFSMSYKSRTYFYTDTNELTKQYNNLDTTTFRTLPIPCSYNSKNGAQFTDTPLNIVYLGDARKEKGYNHLPLVIQDLFDDFIQTRKINFIIQSNSSLPQGEVEVDKAKRLLEKYSNNVKLLTQSLSSEEYKNLIQTSDICLLPYERESYISRSSGVFSDAMASGIPAIIPAGTWMARQIASEYNSFIKNIDLKVVGSTKMTGIFKLSSEPFVMEQECSQLASCLRILFTVTESAPGELIEIIISQSQDPPTSLVIEVPENNTELLSAFFSIGTTKKLSVKFSSLRGNPVIISNMEVNFLSSDSAFPLGTIGLCFNNVNEIPCLIREMIKNYPHYRNSAHIFSKKWIGNHNPNNLVRVLKSVASSKNVS